MYQWIIDKFKQGFEVLRARRAGHRDVLLQRCHNLFELPDIPAKSKLLLLSAMSKLMGREGQVNTLSILFDISDELVLGYQNELQLRILFTNLIELQGEELQNQVAVYLMPPQESKDDEQQLKLIKTTIESLVPPNWQPLPSSDEIYAKSGRKRDEGKVDVVSPQQLCLLRACCEQNVLAALGLDAELPEVSLNRIRPARLAGRLSTSQSRTQFPASATVISAAAEGDTDELLQAQAPLGIKPQKAKEKGQRRQERKHSMSEMPLFSKAQLRMLGVTSSDDEATRKEDDDTHGLGNI